LSDPCFAEIDDILRVRESVEGASADDIFTHMSAYIEAPAET
jgi:hypothetical protein